MATRRLKVGTEDNLQQIDVNADGKTDVYVLTDVAPQAAQTSPLGPFALGQGSTPDPDLAINARSVWDKDTDGPHAVSATNPATGG